MKLVRLAFLFYVFMALASRSHAEPCPKDFQIPRPDGSLTIAEQDARSHLLEHKPPKYPGLARAARVQGVVVVTAVIQSDGTISTITPVCGERILIEATIKAVKKWRYQPFEVNGKPVVVITTIRTEFDLNKKD